MPENENVVLVAPTRSVPELRRSSRLACSKNKELMPSVTMKKRKKTRTLTWKDYARIWHKVDSDIDNYIYRTSVEFAEQGLKLYKKTDKKSEYEVQKVLSYVTLRIGLRCEPKDPKKWCHVCFIAKPKKNSHSAKHFFAELSWDNDSNDFIAENCFPFQPSSDEGFKHRCVICEAKTRIYPGPNEDKYGDGKSYKPRN